APSDLLAFPTRRSSDLIYSLRERNDDLLSRMESQARARNMSSVVREMWYPIRVCTPHQILRFTLQGRGWETMLSEFPNSCFVFRSEEHTSELQSRENLV